MRPLDEALLLQLRRRQPVGENSNSVAGVPFSMSESTAPAFVPNVSAGHLSVHLDPSYASDIPFLFEQQEKRIGPAFLASFGSHVAVAVIILLALRYGGRTTQGAAVFPQDLPNQIIWLSQPGPGGGGGGGGNQMK